MRPVTLPLLLLAALSSSACHDIYLSDDIDLDLNFSLLTGPSDALHLPYVVGTKVIIWANRVGADREEKQSYWLESSDPRVLRIDSQREGRAECTALGAGEAEVLVYERREESHPASRSLVSVRAPTKIGLLAHGPLIVGAPGAGQELRQARVVTGGTATFLVRYYEGETPLYGNGVLEATSSSSIDLTERTTFLFENREWLQVTPRAPGLHAVRLSASGRSLDTLEVLGVSVEEIARIELIGQYEDGAEDDATLAVLAQAYDAAERPIYGAEYHWDLDGTAEKGEGDLYRYHYSAKQRRTLAARIGDHQALASINASEGWVSSTNFVGCSVGTGRGATAGLLLLGFPALLLLVRRRRSTY